VDEQERYRLGRDLILEVWGEEFGGQILRRLNGLAPDLEHQIVSHLYGNLWTREPPAPDRKTRSLITVAVLTALHRPNQLRVHLVGALNNGASEAEIVEIVLQVGLLAGFPTSWDALIMCGQVFEEYRSGTFTGSGDASDATAKSFGV
jgi:4-carboxymuconolactone decarboxylase